MLCAVAFFVAQRFVLTLHVNMVFWHSIRVTANKRDSNEFNKFSRF